MDVFIYFILSFMHEYLLWFI